MSYGDTEYGYNFKMMHKVENMAVVFLGRVTEGEVVKAQHGGRSRVVNDTTLAYESGQALKVRVLLLYPSVSRNRGSLSLT